MFYKLHGRVFQTVTHEAYGGTFPGILISIQKYRKYLKLWNCKAMSAFFIKWLFSHKINDDNNKTNPEINKFAQRAFNSLIKVLKINITEQQILCYLTVQTSPLTRLSCLSSLLVINCPWWIVSSITQTTDLSSLDNSQLCWQMSALWIRFSLLLQFYLMEISKM